MQISWKLKLSHSSNCSFEKIIPFLCSAFFLVLEALEKNLFFFFTWFTIKRPFLVSCFQSVYAVEAFNSSLVISWMNVIFDNQEQLYNFQTMDKDRYDVIK